MDYSDIGRMLRSLRQAAGLTQRQVADELGMTDSNVSLLEAGKVRSPLDTLQRYAELVGATLDVTIRTEAETLLERRLLRALRTLPQHHRRSLLALLAVWEAEQAAAAILPESDES